MPPTQENNNDFDPKDLTRSVDQHQADLDDIKSLMKGLEGKELDDKICKAIKDSTHIQEKIGSIVWSTIKQKLVWILLTLLAILLWESIKDIISIITTTISNINIK